METLKELKNSFFNLSGSRAVNGFNQEGISRAKAWSGRCLSTNFGKPLGLNFGIVDFAGGQMYSSNSAGDGTAEKLTRFELAVWDRVEAIDSYNAHEVELRMEYF